MHNACIVSMIGMNSEFLALIFGGQCQELRKILELLSWGLDLSNFGIPGLDFWWSVPGSEEMFENPVLGPKFSSFFQGFCIRNFWVFPFYNSII